MIHIILIDRIKEIRHRILTESQRDEERDISRIVEELLVECRVEVQEVDHIRVLIDKVKENLWVLQQSIRQCRIEQQEELVDIVVVILIAQRFEGRIPGKQRIHRRRRSKPIRKAKVVRIVIEILW